MVLVQPLIGDSMEFKRIISPTLKELFIEEIETQILSGTLAIGEKLPPGREIAKKCKFLVRWSMMVLLKWQKKVF